MRNTVLGKSIIWGAPVLLILSFVWRVSDNVPRQVLPPTVAEPSFFGTEEIRSSNIAPFTKWLGVLDRWKREQSATIGICEKNIDVTCVPQDWAKLVRELKGAALETSVQRVNEAINRYPFIESFRNWGGEHWETPFEFIRRGGQCQDYAIAKFMLLRAIGIANDALRFVVLNDLRGRRDHAVAVAYADGDILLMDNLLTRVVSTSLVTWYKPYYSINETYWWRHVMAGDHISGIGDIARGRIAVGDAPASTSGNALNARISCTRP